MNRALLPTVLVLALMLASTSALAETGRGQIGSQSRASVRISVSVTPRLAITSGRASQPTAWFPNTPTLRVSMVPDSNPTAGTVGSGHNRQTDPHNRSVLLVVPD